MSKIQVILMEPHRTAAAHALGLGPEVEEIAGYLGPVFEDCTLEPTPSGYTITADDGKVKYHYPAHTVARIKETV